MLIFCHFNLNHPFLYLAYQKYFRDFWLTRISLQPATVNAIHYRLQVCYLQDLHVVENSAEILEFRKQNQSWKSRKKSIFEKIYPSKIVKNRSLTKYLKTLFSTFM